MEEFQYWPEYEIEPGENRKIWHNIILTTSGLTIDADFTPYDEMDHEDVRNYISMRRIEGDALRNGISPWDKKSLQDYHNKNHPQDRY